MIDLKKVIAAGKKQTAENKAKNGKAAIVWTPEEMNQVNEIAKVCLSGELSKKVIGEMFKASRALENSTKDFGIDKSSSAFNAKLDEVYKQLKTATPKQA